MRRAVKVRIARRQARLGVRSLHKKGAAGLGGLLPERAVLLRSPARPQLIERRQMIRRIGERMRHHVRHKQDHWRIRVHHRPHRVRSPLARCGNQLPVHHCVQQLLRLGVIVVNPLAIAPAIGRKQERHRKVRFAVRRGAFGVVRSIRFAAPREKLVARRLRGADVHVGLRPVPDRVELSLLVELDGNHHAVGHALGTHVVVGPVRDVRQRPIRILSGAEGDGLRLGVAVEELLIGGFNLRVNRALGVAVLCEQIWIFAGGVRAGAVVERLRGCRGRQRRRQHQRRPGCASQSLLVHGSASGSLRIWAPGLGPG